VTLHTTLQGVGIEQAYGPSIILFTLILKLLTFPLNKQQIESTSKMQAIQPAAKALQEKYRNKDPARLNLELQKLYQDNQVNPLAGCLPSLAQIPIFIGLYRSVLNLAKADKLDEGFLWLPSLEGPVSDYTKGSGWLFGDAAQGYAWTDFTPPLGWADTGAYLALPVLLVCSQYISTSILTPKSDDPAQQQTQAILKFLPLMIGWFSLSVPSGLGLYWITNNVVTTATTLLIRNSVPTPSVAGMDGGVSSAEPVKSQGFGRQYGEVVTKQSEDGTTVKISPPGTRKERRAAAADGPVVDAVVVDAAMGAAATGGPAAAAQVVDAQITELDTGGGVGGDAGGKKKKKKKSKKAKK
jgi:YidC/Oxa1 family membrane protein insertase